MAANVTVKGPFPYFWIIMLDRPIVPVFLILLGLMSCFARQADLSSNEPAHRTASVQEVKPPSELALLMRTMAAHADSVKAAIKLGSELPPYPKEIATLFTATPTEGMHIDPITYP